MGAEDGGGNSRLLKEEEEEYSVRFIARYSELRAAGLWGRNLPRRSGARNEKRSTGPTLCSKGRSKEDSGRAETRECGESIRRSAVLSSRLSMETSAALIFWSRDMAGKAEVTQGKLQKGRQLEL